MSIATKMMLASLLAMSVFVLLRGHYTFSREMYVRGVLDQHFEAIKEQVPDGVIVADWDRLIEKCRNIYVQCSTDTEYGELEFLEKDLRSWTLSRSLRSREDVLLLYTRVANINARAVEYSEKCRDDFEELLEEVFDEKVPMPANGKLI